MLPMLFTKGPVLYAVPVWYVLNLFTAAVAMPAGHQQAGSNMVKRAESHPSGSTASSSLETRLPQREMSESDEDGDNLDKRDESREIICECSDCCPDDPDEDRYQDEYPEEEPKKKKKGKGKGKGKKNKKKKKTLYSAIRKSGVAPYVRFVIHESLRLPGEYDPRQLDIRFCGEDSFDNNWVQWHSEKEAMSINEGARIKCQTFFLRDVRKNTASVGVFDVASNIVWDSNPLEGKYTPRLITDSNFQAPARYRQYEFDCKKYDYLDKDTGIYYLGWKCKIISADQSGRRMCLEPLEFQAYGGANVKGNLTALPCSRGDEEDEDYPLIYWDIQSAAMDFQTPEMLAVTVNMPIKDVPTVPREVPYYGY